MEDPRQTLTDEELSMLLRSIDHAPPDLRADKIMSRARRRHTRRSTLIAAAAFVAAATVAAAAVPGSALREYIRRAVAPREPRTAQVAAPAQSSASIASVSRGISFVPERRTRIAFAAEQSSGMLRVRVTDARSLRITQSSPDREAQFTLTPDGASVGNSGSTASYEILLPSGISDAVILVAGTSVYSRTRMHSSCVGTRDAEQGCVISMHRTANDSGSASGSTGARRP